LASKRNADLALLNSRLLIATTNFIDGAPQDEADKSMKDVLKAYAYAREEVRASFKFVLDYLMNHRIINTRPTKEDVTEVKKKINQIATLVWKLKKR